MTRILKIALQVISEQQPKVIKPIAIYLLTPVPWASCTSPHGSSGKARNILLWFKKNVPTIECFVKILLISNNSYELRCIFQKWWMGPDLVQQK